MDRFSTKKVVGLAALAIGLSAAIVAPAMGVQSSFVFAGTTTSIPQGSVSKDVGTDLTRPTGTVDPYSLDLSQPSEVVEPATAPSSSPAAKPTTAPVAVLATAPVVSDPAPQETPDPTPAPAPSSTQAPVVQQPTTAPVVGTVSVSQVTPGTGIGEAVLQWSSIPGATEYRIFKTGTIRPSWRLFYVYPSSITSITIFDQPGSIAIYKIMVVVDSKETFLGEVTYRPAS
jgi:hypothetical protein